jgi:hypothetical protein
MLVENPGGKRLPERSRHRWEDNIKMDPREVGWGSMAGLIWLRIGNSSGHFRKR